MAKECLLEIIDETLTAATAVHSILGPGLLESIYQHALAYELRARGLDVQVEAPIFVTYRGIDLGVGYRADIVVCDALILEIKSMSGVDASHVAQLLTYLRLSGIRVGYILNFNHRLLKHGIKRVSDFSAP
ncbi:GxxExxY protein [Povalibacter uvarum]|uniref:GxxExxY protein n=1 Tax=Povalibacter uvarum TaxID=732238 RepID=A0A841HJK3_9GAMM|nr:GxxExxY protein [Povalibacter uvarum]MBB6092764.1 GxxExxY protein [Povalibacter uvarum]